MGCDSLRDIVEPESASLSTMAKTNVAIDTSFWANRYYHETVTNQVPRITRVVADTADISQALSLLASLPDLLRHNINPIFIFDPLWRAGSNRAGVASAAPYLQDAPEVGHVDEYMPFLQRPTELLLNCLDVPYSEAPLFAEAEASVLAKNGHVEFVVGRDYDTLLYGAPLTMRKPGSNWELIRLSDVLERNGLGYLESPVMLLFA